MGLHNRPVQTLPPPPFVFTSASCTGSDAACCGPTRGVSGLKLLRVQRPLSQCNFGMTAAAGTRAIVRLGSCVRSLIPEGAES